MKRGGTGTAVVTACAFDFVPEFRRGSHAALPPFPPQQLAYLSTRPRNDPGVSRQVVCGRHRASRDVFGPHGTVRRYSTPTIRR